jgi:large subunit ribosomal protein L21
MYAILETGGKQYRVAQGDTIKVELLPQEIGEKVSLDRVLMINKDSAVTLGKPTVVGAKVEATVLSQGRGKKITIFKMRRRKHYKKSMGHRQYYTELRIDSIVL